MLRNLPFRIALTSALVLNLAAGPAILSAQQVSAEIPDITIRTNTRLVVVDVVVRDKKGQPVTGLKPEDFTLEENGKKQKIATFTPPGVNQGNPQTPPPGILSNQPENVTPAGALTVLLLDATNSSFTNQAYARSQMLKYVTEQSHTGNVMAVATLTDRLHLLQGFTSDPQILLTAIRNFKPESQVLQPAPPPPGMDTAESAGGHGGGQAATMAAATAAEVASFANLQIGYNIERRTLITLDAMRTLARMLGGLQGRKNVVWLTANLPFDLIPEDRNISNAELAADLPGSGRQRSAMVNGAGSIAAEARSLHSQEIKDAESQLASTNIAIYPVDLHGLVGGMESLASRSEAHSNDIHEAGLANAALSQSLSLVNSQDTMREIAQETGGKAYMNENEIRQGVALAVADDRASYSLGYYPENKKWDGKYRSIKVKLSQGDTEIRYRKGYFAVDSSQEKNPNYQQAVVAALAFNTPATQISFKAQAKPTDPGKMRVVFLVDAHTLTAEDSGGNKKMNVSLYATIWSSSDKSLAQGSIKVDKSFDAATYQQILDHGMMVPIDMEMPAAGTQLRLAVLDNKTGFIGTVSGALGQ
jgi:VWFA-related protein